MRWFHDILQSLSLAQSLRESRNVPIWRIGNREVNADFPPTWSPRTSPTVQILNGEILKLTPTTKSPRFKTSIRALEKLYDAEEFLKRYNIVRIKSGNKNF